ncbi:MAG: GNAT family N-acetyltransferase [Tannerella sp.]|nr:GNAT family N-acetyltransferase [Tannerella sp.]
MKEKESYRRLCGERADIPLYTQAWWLDAACGSAERWEVLLYREKGQLRAAMPLYCPLPRLVSMPPYTQTMGPWFAPEPSDLKPSARLARRQTALSYFIDTLRPCRSFLQNFSHAVTDWLPFYWAGYRQTTRYTYLLHGLCPERWDDLSPNIRRNIRRAEKAGIEVRRGLSAEALLRLQGLSFARQGKSPKHEGCLMRLIAAARQREQGDIWGAFDTEGRLHAAAFIAWQGDTAYYIAGGGDPALRDSGAHSLVLWTAILALGEHVRTFDFEGSMLPGVERFFREFGAIQTPYFSISKGKLSLAERLRIHLRNRREGLA